jgi:hypothetical protein
MEFAMPDPINVLRSADILAFRPRVKVPDGRPDAAEAKALADASVEGPHVRLQRAMAALDDALARQKTAVADWRSSMSQLGSQVDGLGGALQRLDGSLGALHAQVTEFHEGAVQLEVQAGKLLAATIKQ